MKIYDITCPFSNTMNHIHSIVADSMGKAEELFLKAYPGVKIMSIELHSEFAIIQEPEEEPEDICSTELKDQPKFTYKEGIEMLQKLGISTDFPI